MNVPESKELIQEGISRSYAQLEARLLAPADAADVRVEQQLLSALASLLARDRKEDAQDAGYSLSSRYHASYARQVPLTRTQLFTKLRQLPSRRLVGYLMDRPLDPISHYNLAIYYNALAKSADKSEMREPAQDLGMHHLREAIQEPVLAAEVTDDPRIIMLQQAIISRP